MATFLQLNDIDCYCRAFNLSNYVWRIIVKWNYFPRKTVGSQFVRAIDSISANIAEGFGRYHKKDKIKFYHYAFGSVKEGLDWNEKSKVRKLINKSQYSDIFEELNLLPKEINQLIKFTKIKLEK